MPEKRIDAADELRKINELRQEFRKHTQLNDKLVFAVLAVAYLLGFDGQYVVAILFPHLMRYAGFMVAALGSLALFLILLHSFRRYKGIRGGTAARPTFFGVAWLLGLFITMVIVVLISIQCPKCGVAQIAYISSCLMIGLMYACGGVLLSIRRDFFLGLWLIGVGALGGILGMPILLLIIGTLGSLGFLVCAFTSPSMDRSY